MGKKDWRADLESMNRGDLPFGAAFFENHGPVFKRLEARTLCGMPCGSVDASDVRQVTMLATWQAVRAWTPDSFAAISTCVQTHVVQELTRVNKRQWWGKRHIVENDNGESVATFVCEALCESEDPCLADDPDQELALERKERAAYVMAKLPHKPAAVVRRVFRGMSFDEALEDVHGPMNTAALKKARQRVIAAVNQIVECSLS